MKERKAPDRTPAVKPVEKIELSEKHIKLRIALVILLIVAALGAFAAAILFWRSTDAGWRQIAASTDETNCSSEFIFFYEISEGGLKGTEELEAVSAAYGEAAVKAYRLFEPSVRFEGMNNLASVNAAPNLTVTVDETLYSALELVQRFDVRLLYFAPVYALYDSLFYSLNDELAAEYDPYRSEEAAELIARIAGFVNDGESIRLELLGEGKVRLNVSEEYTSFLHRNGFTAEDGTLAYLDFFFLRNAFAIDLIAGRMTAAGFTRGQISSLDGYSRVLNDGGAFSMDVYDAAEDGVWLAGKLTGEGAVSAVRLRSHSVGTSGAGHFYTFEDGKTAHPYIDTEDGLYKSCIGDLIAYSRGTGCAEIVLSLLPLYTAETFDGGKTESLKEQGILSVYCLGREVFCLGTDVGMTAFSYDDRVYTVRRSG